MGAGGRASVVLVAVLAAATGPAAAHAGPRADYRQVFTTAVPGAPTGIDTQILYKHPDDANAKPIPIRQEVFTFPPGTQFDESVATDCTVPDLVLQLQGESACPPESWVGAGHGNTSMTGFPGTGETPVAANAFDYGGNAFRVLGHAEEFPFSSLRFIAHGDGEGNVRTVEIPETPGTPPYGGALRRIHNVFPERSAGDRASVRTPPTCPRSRVWTFTVDMTFADGVVERNVHQMPCRRKP